MSVFQNKNDLLFNVNNPHNLIPKNKATSFEQNMHYFSINTNNRDKRLFPNTNNFTIRLPITLSNINSFSLFSIYFTGPIYNFSKNLGNSSFKIGTYSISETESTTIKLQDGNYTINSIINYINQLLSSLEISIDYLISQNRFVFFNNKPVDNENSNRFYIESVSNMICNNNDNFINSKDLLFCLGFDVNTNYNRIDSIFTNDIRSDVFLFEKNLTNENNWSNYNNNGGFFAMANSQPRFRSDEPIFIEIEKFNVNISETADLNNFNSAHHASNNGSIFNSFAKIDATSYNFSTFDSLTSGIFNGIVDNVTKKFTQPVNNMGDLRFKFRYRDNTLVDLQNTSIDLTIAFTITNERIISSI